jgi:hypothetical protein
MRLHPDQDCNAIVTTRDGASVAIKSSRLWEQDLAHFENWFCSAGMTYVFIDHDLNVYGGQCRQAPLGNLMHDDFKLNRCPVRCEREVCTPCESDLYTAKWRPGD